MGAALLDLTQLDLGHSQDITLELKDPVRPKQHLGEIYLTATLWPRNQQEKEQVLILFNLRKISFKKLFLPFTFTYLRDDWLINHIHDSNDYSKIEKMKC